MRTPKYKKRWLAHRLRDAVDFSPVLVLTGARQTGKSTLLRNEPPFMDWPYVSFDDLDILALADRHPEEILEMGRNMVIDEVQRSPGFLYAVKRLVDKDRSRRLVLSGSANLLLMKKVSESLAGRAIYFNLFPFGHSEFHEKEPGGWLHAFLNTGNPHEEELPTGVPVHGLLEILFRGFLPPAAFIGKESHTAMWWEGYVKTYLERDLRQVSEISHLSDFKRMMELLALRTANILKQSEISRDAGLSQATAGRYINILETTNLFIKLRPYAVNMSKRLIKSPKAFFVDSGLAASLSGLSSASAMPLAFAGALLESFVFLNLQLAASLYGGEIHYFRTQGGKEKEVDFLYEKDRKITAVEVKLADRVSVGDISAMLFLKEKMSQSFRGGLVVYAGNEFKQLAGNIYAVPWYFF